jgi:hypothetical protein
MLAKRARPSLSEASREATPRGRPYWATFATTLPPHVPNSRIRNINGETFKKNARRKIVFPAGSLTLK